MEKMDFKPDWVSAPGDTIADILQERSLSLIEFAQQMECTTQYIEQLLKGYVTITIDRAQQLETVLGASKEFWITRERQYREGLNYLQQEVKSPVSQEWLKELPVKDMINFGWLKSSLRPAERVEACLHFFGVSSVEEWRNIYSDELQLAAFRASPTFESQPGAVAAWLRQGEIESWSINCNRWNAQRFKNVLQEIRLLTRERDLSHFIPQLKRYCAECGVAVVIVRAPNGCRMSGATRFLSSNKALLMLSFRHLSDDHFWFTFFHEAAHLLLHGKKVLFLEGDKLSSEEEEEANEFARLTLIPPEHQAGLLKLTANKRDVIRFARQVGISRGVVVGQLQHLGKIPRNMLNNLKRWFQWE